MGWAPKVSLGSGLIDTIDWYKKIDKKLKKKKNQFQIKKNQKNKLLYSKLIKSKSLKKFTLIKKDQVVWCSKGILKKMKKTIH